MRLAPLLLLVLATVCASGAVSAHELQVFGRAAVPIDPNDPAGTKSAARRAATVQALRAAIDKVLGPGMSADPRIAPRLGELLGQLSDGEVLDGRGERIGASYELSVSLVLDDKHFRMLLSDLGLALNTGKNRTHAILALMDEFLTTPRDIHAPVEDLETYHRESGAQSSDQSKGSSKSSSQDHAMVGAAGHGGSLHGSSASSASDATDVKLDQRSEAHDNVSYQHLIKYQPAGVPEKTSQTYNALVAQLQDYDLRMMDNDAFRSRFFKSQPLTIQALNDSEHLARYVAFANTEAHAELLMVGTTIIIDSGRSATTGAQTCSGVASIKTYSTVTAESVASETISEVASGQDLHDCAGQLAKKLADVGGPLLGARISRYWKTRELYGREYVLTLVGDSLPLVTRASFVATVKRLPGVANVTQRSATGKRLELVVQYKGEQALDEAIALALTRDAAYATLDSRSDSTHVLLCLGPCPPAAP